MYSCGRNVGFALLCSILAKMFSVAVTLGKLTKPCVDQSTRNRGGDLKAVRGETKVQQQCTAVQRKIRGISSKQHL